MANTRTLNRSFAGGEISPEMYGRIDDSKYQAGAALLSNFIATPQGPAENRPGFAFVRATKNNGVARLIPFSFSIDQTMVLEFGDHYIRFHTNGETLEYNPADAKAWVASSPDLGITLTTPAVVTWNAHGLTDGDPIQFYISAGSISQLPVGLKIGYTYTVDVLDANTFQILDNGSAIGLTEPASGGLGPTTNHVGSGSPSASASAAPHQTVSNISSSAGSFASTPVSGGIAQLNASVTNNIDALSGFGEALFEYTADGSTWRTFYSSHISESKSVSVNINIANLNTLKVRVVAIATGSSDGSSTNASIGSWSVDVPTGSPVGTVATMRAFRYYAGGELVSYSGAIYSAVVDGSGGLTTPGTDGTVWNLLPDTTYEVPSPYAASDVFGLHYAQSNDVVTLVHPLYPPAELKRLGATQWKLTTIAFGQKLAAPTLVSAVGSPGFLAQISSVSGSPSVFTTVSNHTLALGDGVYVSNIVISGVTKSDFFLVADIPVDGTGALIKNELKLMDYSGNMVTATLGTGPTIQFGGKIFDITNYYVVTALSADGINESPVSKEVSVLDNLNVTGSFNTISWAAVDGAATYYVYKKKNGLYGFIGQTNGTSFDDNNIAPDFSITPPTFDPVFASAGNYPTAVSYFDQRRCFAGTANDPQNVWMSKTGTEADFSYSIPVKDTDRIAFRVASLQANSIQHIIPLSQLLLLTNSAEMRVSPVNSDAITPSDISVKPQSYIGASGVQPTIVNNALVYCASRGGHIRELGYSWQANGFITGDLSLRAAHLFDNLAIVDQCYSKCPRPIVWFVSSSGKLLGLTYIPEEQIGAWHQHNTDGFFESITAVSEGNEDRLYAVIRRTINGSTVRYIERMASRIIDAADSSTWFFVDAGATYSGVATKVISGLTWLEGKTVSILADGAVVPRKVVTSGQITLDHAASVVQVGLPYDFDLQTLPLILQIDGFGQGRTKNINKVWVRVLKSSGVFAGPDDDHLIEYKQRTTEAYGAPPNLKTDELEIVITPSWQSSGQIVVHGSDPLPLSVVGITMQVAIGG